MVVPYFESKKVERNNFKLSMQLVDIDNADLELINLLFVSDNLEIHDFDIPDEDYSIVAFSVLESDEDELKLTIGNTANYIKGDFMLIVKKESGEYVGFTDQKELDRIKKLFSNTNK